MSEDNRIGFSRNHQSKRPKWLFQIHWGYVFLIVLLRGIMNGVNTMVAFTKEKEPSLMQRIAERSAVSDIGGSAAAYHIAQIAEVTSKEKPLFPDYKESLEVILNYGSDEGGIGQSVIGAKFPRHRQLFHQLSTFKDDLYSLLGEDGGQRYLILLQNTSEKRPNGGFFGSFVELVIDRGRVVDFELVDSYLPQYDSPGTSMRGPAWLEEFLPTRMIHFIGANKIGFTYHDGAHIKTLYEKSYPGKRVRGVVFVSTDMFEELLPGFRDQQYYWQFINASVDLIRGEARWGKKSLYLNQGNEYFEANKETLFKQAVLQLPDLLNKGYINIYLDNISGPFHGRLRRVGLTTRFESDLLYSWESNISFNKSDQFVSKIIKLTNEDGDVISEQSSDRVLLSELSAGRYQVDIYYQFAVPSDYIEKVLYREEYFGIEFTSREEHILVVNDIPTWSTRGLMYIDRAYGVSPLRGDIIEQQQFLTPFSKGISYVTEINGNNESAVVSFEISVP